MGPGVVSASGVRVRAVRTSRSTRGDRAASDGPMPSGGGEEGEVSGP
ncbi:hypothetical protein KPATCC21470_0243 [Kitasatospora purpeofusca]